jgi:hypothetical protein
MAPRGATRNGPWCAKEGSTQRWRLAPHQAVHRTAHLRDIRPPHVSLYGCFLPHAASRLCYDGVAEMHGGQARCREGTDGLCHGGGSGAGPPAPPVQPQSRGAALRLAAGRAGGRGRHAGWARQRPGCSGAGGGACWGGRGGAKSAFNFLAAALHFLAATPWPLSTPNGAFMGSPGCALPTPRSCRPWFPAPPTPRRS